MAKVENVVKTPRMPRPRNKPQLERRRPHRGGEREQYARQKRTEHVDHERAEREAETDWQMGKGGRFGRRPCRAVPRSKKPVGCGAENGRTSFR